MSCFRRNRRNRMPPRGNFRFSSTCWQVSDPLEPVKLTQQAKLVAKGKRFLQRFKFSSNKASLIGVSSSTTHSLGSPEHTEPSLASISHIRLDEIHALRARITDLEQEYQILQDTLHTLAHEVRTPLQSLWAGFEVLTQFDLPKKARRILQDMSLSGSQIMSNMNTVLDAQRLKHGKMELSISTFSTQDLLDSSVKMVRHLAKAKNIQLISTNSECGPTCLVEGDVARLTQVLVNLLSNAIKFSPPNKTVRLTINIATQICESSTTVTNNQPGNLLIEVQDSGPGMTQEAQDTIFQKFAQADASISGKFGGSGLGLWICQKIIVDCMNGVIGTDRARTAPGKGAVFKVDVPVNLFPMNLTDAGCSLSNTSDTDTLECVRPAHGSISSTHCTRCPHSCPNYSHSFSTSTTLSPQLSSTAAKASLCPFISLSENQESTMPSSSLQDPSTSESQASTPTLARNILVVDDCPVSCRMLTCMLNGMGFSHVDSCGGGADAIAVIGSERKYHMVLTDYNIGDMTGNEVVKSMRSLGREQLWIVGMTGDDRITAAIWAGVDVLIRKPITRRSLLAALTSRPPPLVLNYGTPNETS
mmetsp:Transcript_103834/g.178858  ORF Transcript_103834/g.178858 Transcript_103834/m.178858 type:complete len:588 (-) Transcript_103834:37-1800(-)